MLCERMIASWSLNFSEVLLLSLSEDTNRFSLLPFQDLKLSQYCVTDSAAEFIFLKETILSYFISELSTRKNELCFGRLAMSRRPCNP